ncbi:hypothetical protein [Acinetobacter seifertii]|uniref:hypothetical protein n=1 Tax=Acinetobacter seifertii TaxID=1530123 RepID=UPI000D36F161|nr:hypothetical protein [Acinetobacter seifertii]PTV55351.1 hypothetical protein DBL04_06635 [Acinetobacter seifertii]
MDASNVFKSLNGAYKVAYAALEAYHHNKPDFTKMDDDHVNAYNKEVSECAHKVVILHNLLEDYLKQMVAINRDDFDNAIYKLSDYIKSINGRISDLSIAAECVRLIAEILLVFK